ncbi:hypothetical protein AJ88_31675 [Mesorhizobium amorphae CCBAU 01583]|nr:hypothetical protein AJ88_31675 [Mesorhizobium amorphae CCBAU 01583]
MKESSDDVSPAIGQADKGKTACFKPAGQPCPSLLQWIDSGRAGKEISRIKAPSTTQIDSPSPRPQARRRPPGEKASASVEAPRPSCMASPSARARKTSCPLLTAVVSDLALWSRATIGPSILTGDAATFPSAVRCSTSPPAAPTRKPECA